MTRTQELKDILGINIRDHRYSKNWNQEFLAQKIGITKNAISEIESGKKFISAETLANLASVFEIHAYELFMPRDVMPIRPEVIFAKFSEMVMEVLEKTGKSYEQQNEINETPDLCLTKPEITGQKQFPAL